MDRVPDKAHREFLAAQDLTVKRFRLRFRPIPYEICNEESDDLWGGDIEEDDLWGGNIGERKKAQTEVVQKMLPLYITDRGGIWARSLGFVQARDAIIIVPRLILEEEKIEPRKGDRIYCGDYVFRVVDLVPLGFWRNTGLYLYEAMNCSLV